MPHQLRPSPSWFTGRAGLLDELLGFAESSLHDGSNIVTLSGLGGSGKTTLAGEFARRIKDNYRDGQIYFEFGANAGRAAAAEDVMRHVIRSLRPDVTCPTGAQELTGLYRSCLDDKAVLLFFDDVSDGGVVRQLIPASRCCLVIVTSRHQLGLSGATQLNVDSLSTDEAEALILKLCPRIGEHSASLARLSGNLPVALEANASALARNLFLTADKFLTSLAETHARLEPVAAAFKLSESLLPEKLRDRWRKLATFPASFDVGAAAALWSTDESDAGQSLAELLGASLIQQSVGLRIQLHDLVRDYARSTLSPEQLLRIQAAYCEHFHRLFVSAAADAVSNDTNKQRQATAFVDLEHTNLEEVQRLSEAEGLTDRAAGQRCVNFANFATIWVPAKFPPAQILRWCKTGMDAATKWGNKVGLAHVRLNFANILPLTGEAEASIAVQQKLAKQIGSDPASEDEANVLGNACITCANNGRPQDAIPSGEAFLRYAAKSGKNRWSARVGRALGLAYFEIGLSEQALETLQNALNLAQENDPDVVPQVLIALGTVSVDVGSGADGYGYFDQVLAMESDPKVGRRDVAWAAFEKAKAMAKRGERKAARPLAQKAGELWKEAGSRRVRDAEDLFAALG